MADQHPASTQTSTQKTTQKYAIEFTDDPEGDADANDANEYAYEKLTKFMKVIDNGSEKDLEELLKMEDPRCAYYDLKLANSGKYNDHHLLRHSNDYYFEKWVMCPFIYACAVGNIKAVRILMKDIRVYVVGGRFGALMEATKNGYTEVVKLLLEHPVNTFTIGQTTNRYYIEKALKYAIYGNKIDIIPLLLKYLPDGQEQSRIMRAIGKHGTLESMELVMNARVKKIKENISIIVDYARDDGNIVVLDHVFRNYAKNVDMDDLCECMTLANNMQEKKEYVREILAVVCLFPDEYGKIADEFSKIEGWMKNKSGNKWVWGKLLEKINSSKDQNRKEELLALYAQMNETISDTD
jgi:hypothetical protein